jgi:hypothetical protein
LPRLSYAESDASGKAGTAVGYGQLSQDATQLTNFTVIVLPEANKEMPFAVKHQPAAKMIADGEFRLLAKWCFASSRNSPSAIILAAGWCLTAKGISLLASGRNPERWDADCSPRGQ